MEGHEPQPTMTTLMDWLEGRLPDEAAAEVAARVEAGDPEVTDRLCWLQGFLDVAAQVPLQRPPALVRQNLGQHFTSWRLARSLSRRIRPEVVATLLFDSRHDLPLAQVRSLTEAPETASAEPAHLAYTSRAADLVLDLTPTGPGRVRIDGQVLPLEADVASAFEAVVDGADVRIRTVDGGEDGRFVLEDVPACALSLVVRNADLEVRLELDASDAGA